MSGVDAFYDELSEYYHLIFADWHRSMERQAGVLGPLLETWTGSKAPRVLDCACGIGTQALGLAQRGYPVVGSDLSRASVERARREAAALGFTVPLYVADMRDLLAIPGEGFDVVLAADNALPHLLTGAELALALRQMAAKLRPGGVLVATLRDYAPLLAAQPAVQTPSFFTGEDGRRRIVHQVWDWAGDTYAVHLHLAQETADGWICRHFVSRYRALLREELERGLGGAGLSDVQWLSPEETTYYQPMVMARK